MLKKISILFAVMLTLNGTCLANEYNNQLRTTFLNNKTNIYGLNIRTFNAKDLNNNDIIDNNEESGNFLNAIERLDELKELNINTLHVLPITPVGKLKALGTAGSVYAASDFWTINPQLVDKKSDLTDLEQAKLFINECHKRNIAVIIDLPSCGAYDLFLTHPELFVKDDKQCSIVPTDWTDVRLLNTGTNKKLNEDVLDAHKTFMNFIIDLGADGLRADVATIKPSLFWKEIIDYTRNIDKEFLFLAEASDSWREPPSKYAVFTPYNKLLQAGFDGYYGSFFNLKEWNGVNFIEHIRFNQELLNSYKEDKSVILSFTTHDEVSPIILHGEEFSIMISWLEATLPYNTYIIDGFQSGDDYLYSWANTKANITETDDDFYFAHRGKLDIFNYSRKPDGKNDIILNNLKKAYKFREQNIELITKNILKPLNVKNKNIFAYKIASKDKVLIVIGNLNFEKQENKIKINTHENTRNSDIKLIHSNDNIKITRNHIFTDMAPGEIKVLFIENN